MKLLFHWMLAFCMCMAFLAGMLVARKYSTNPTIIKWEQQAIVLTHGEVRCPDGHTCQWKVWDLNTNSEVAR